MKALALTCVLISGSALANHWTLSCDDGSMVRVSNGNLKVIEGQSKKLFSRTTNDETPDRAVFIKGRERIILDNRDFRYGSETIGESLNIAHISIDRSDFHCDVIKTLVIDNDLK